MIRVTGEKQKSEIAYAIQKYNKSTIYSYGDFCPSYLDTYMTCLLLLPFVTPSFSQNESRNLFIFFVPQIRNCMS